MSIHSRQKRKRWGCNPRSDCQKMTSIHAAAFSEYSVKPTTHQALAPSAPIWLYCKAMFVMDLLISSASAKAWRQRYIKVGVLLEGSMVKTKWHLTLTCESLWFKTWQTIQKSTVAYSLYIFDNSPRSEIKDETTAPPNKQNFFLPKNVKDMTWTHAAAFNGDNRTPGLGALGTNRVVCQLNVRDGRVCRQRLGQGLETETDQGWRLHPGLYRSNRDHWNPENTWHLTLTCESLWYRT